MPLDLSGPNLEAELLRQALNPPAQVQQVQEEPKKIGKWSWISLLAGQGADMGTTAYGLTHGYKEANHLLDNNIARILAIKAGTIGGNALIMKWLEKGGRDKAAKAVGYIGGASGAIPAALNLRTLTKDR